MQLRGLEKSSSFSSIHARCTHAAKDLPEVLLQEHGRITEHPLEASFCL
jgi:hypothetical protein